MRYRKILKKVREADALGTNMHEEPYDILGVLYHDMKRRGESTLTVLNKMRKEYGLGPSEWDELIRENDSFEGTPEERHSHMIEYLVMMIEVREEKKDVNLEEAEEW